MLLVIQAVELCRQIHPNVQSLTFLKPRGLCAVPINQIGNLLVPNALQVNTAVMQAFCFFEPIY